MKHTPEQIEITREFLKRFNGWRRADYDMEMPNPKETGIHIDIAIEILGELAYSAQKAKHEKDLKRAT